MTSPVKSKDLLKAKIKKSHLTPAHFSINGVIQIQGGSNIHLGHNLTVGQTTEKPLRPEEPSINPHALERLKAFDEEVNQRHRTLVARHIGSDWRYLGRELAGFSNAQMDHLEENFKAGKYTFHEMVYQLLLKWEDSASGETTLGVLARALHTCGMNAALQQLIALCLPKDETVDKNPH